MQVIEKHFPNLTPTQKEQFENAIHDFDRVLSQQNDHLDALLNRGVANSKNGKFAAAIDDYEAVLKLAPDNHQVKSYLEIARQRLNES